jgi:hypothetical protein
MEKNKGSIEAALFIEISDDENSIEIVSSPRLSQGGPRQPSSIRSQVKDVKNSMPGSILGDDLSVPSQWTELERYRNLKEAANTVIDTEFAELDAWLDEI